MYRAVTLAFMVIILTTQSVLRISTVPCVNLKFKDVLTAMPLTTVWPVIMGTILTLEPTYV